MVVLTQEQIAENNRKLRERMAAQKANTTPNTSTTTTVTPGIDPTTGKPSATVTGGVPIPVPAKPVTPPLVTPSTTPKEEPKPYQPGAADYVQADYNKGRDYGDQFSDIFGENVMPSSAEAALRELARSQEAERQYQSASQKLTKGINERQLAATKRESEAAQAASVAAFAQNREGAMSGTAQDVISRYSGISNERMRTATDQVTLANLQMEEAQKQLREAQRSGSQGAIERYMGAVAQAEQQIRQANIDLANAESRALSEARQFQASERQNIQTFTGLLDSGVQLDLAGVLSISSQLGVPTDLATSYYAATEQIRNDKTLSSEAKQIELETARQDFNDRITGFQTKEAQKIRDYERLVKQGYNPSELAMMMDIPNGKNPVYQAELRAMNAKARIAEAEANGVLLNPMDRLKYAQALAESAEMLGQGEVYLPSGTKYPITPTGTGISIGAVEGDYGGQCGRFVNNVVGKAGFIQDSYEQKLSLINSHVPQPGMIGVQAAPGESAKYGHVFVVEKVNPDGTMDIVESNFGNNEKISRRRVPIDRADGFIVPPNSTPTTTKGSQYTTAQTALMDTIDPAKITETTQKILKENGLTTNDLFTYLSTSKKPLPEEKRVELEAVIEGIETLRGMDQSGAVGFGWQKLLWGDQAEKGFLPGTEASNFKAEFDRLKDTLALPALDKLKGAMSDKDIQFLRNTATSLSLDMSENQFNKTLDRLEKKYREILNQGTTVDTEPRQNNDPLNLFTPVNDPLGLFN